MFDFLFNLSGKEINMIFYALLFILFLWWAIPKIRKYFRNYREEQEWLSKPKGLSDPEIYKDYFGYYPEGYEPEDPDEDFEDEDDDGFVVQLPAESEFSEKAEKKSPGIIIQFPGNDKKN